MIKSFHLARAFALVGLLFAGLAISASPPVTRAQRAAEAHAKALGEIVSTYDPAAWNRYRSEHFSAQMQKRPSRDHLQVFGDYWDRSRGLTFQSIQSRAPDEITALYQTRLTGDWEAVTFHVESQPPYRLTEVQWAPAQAPPSPKRHVTEKVMVDELTALIKRLTEADAYSGVVLLARDGMPVYQAAFGAANKDFGAPNRLDTKFNLGSMNKMFTAVSIMQLIEQGKLSLSDPLAKYLPDFPDAESAKKIRIEHLLSHSAGLGGYFSERFESLSRDRIRRWTT